MDPLGLCQQVRNAPSCAPLGRGQPIDNGVLITGMIFRFVAFLIIVALLVWLVSRLLSAWGHRQHTASPFTELDLAYARGILTRDDYFTRRADLSGFAGGAPGAQTPAAPTEPGGLAPHPPASGPA